MDVFAGLRDEQDPRPPRRRATRWHRALLLGTLAAASAGTGAALSAAQGPALPPESAPVRVAVPIDPPPKAGRPAVGRLELRLERPGGGEPYATLVFAQRDRQTGRRVRPAATCFETAEERMVRRYPTLDGGRCSRAGGDPLAFGVSGGPYLPTVIDGIAPPAVERMTVAGPGGTWELPLSRSRAYAAAYAATATEDVTVTAHLRDGTTRSRTVSLAPGHRLEGAVTAPDPEGGPAWEANAHLRRHGARRGQTCPVFQQRTERMPDGGVRGGEFGPPLCGDLRRDPLVASTLEMRPGTRHSTFGPGPHAPERTILWGAAGPSVASVAVRWPGGERELPLSERGRAFIVVLPSSVRARDLVLIVRSADGTSREHPAPARLHAAPLNPRAIRFTAPLRATWLESPPRIRVTAGLSRPPKRLTVFVLGRPLTLRRVPGTRRTYAATYDATRGRYRRRARPGRPLAVTYTLCAPRCTGFRHRTLILRRARAG